MVSLIDWRAMPNGKEKYGAYLASREWAVIKVAIRERSEGTCEHCKHDPATQCHHMTYDRLYNELLTDLLDVCEPCHRFLSGKSKEDPREYWIEKPPVKPYGFVVLPEGASRQIVECPVCRGVGNSVHLGSPSRSSEGKSKYIILRFWCECGEEFSWQFEDRKGCTYLDMEVTPLASRIHD